MINIDDLVEDITSFYYDWDTYEFNDIYEDYDMGLADTKEILSSEKLTYNMLYDIKEICNDIKDDNDSSIKNLFKKGCLIIDSLEKYLSLKKEDYEL